MYNFLKTLFELRKKKLTFVLWEDSFPDEPQSFSFFPNTLLRIFIVLCVALVVFVSTLFYITPLGNLLFNNEDAEIRQSVIQVTSRLMNLQDSLRVRDEQLENMKAILRSGVDTTFIVGPIRTTVSSTTLNNETSILNFSSPNYDFLREPEVSFNVNTRRAPVFPVQLPVSGILTQTYKTSIGHFGIDIAAEVGTTFRSIADGVVVSTEWTINYGYIIQVQHGDGYLSIFKHCQSPYKKTGDIIQKGDILGAVSDTGILSSGPHLHFELWHNGQPLNPINYIIN
jgi:murein DD-endopeptidase MepM/ murein hydrolase activator NlpD